MALAGLAVTCLATGGPTLVGQLQQLPSRVWWSEDFATDGTTAAMAPSVASEYGPNIFRIFPVVACWIAIGPDPDATTGPRIYLPAQSERDYIVQSGDKLDWIADA